MESSPYQNSDVVTFSHLDKSSKDRDDNRSHSSSVELGTRSWSVHLHSQSNTSLFTLSQNLKDKKHSYENVHKMLNTSGK